MGFVAVLEGVDQVAAGPFVGKGRPRRIKTGWRRTATAAEMIRSGAAEGDPAHDAQRRNNRRHQFTAHPTDMEFSGCWDESAADMTKRGKDDIKGRCEERFQHPGSESEIRIDHQHQHVRQARLAVYDGGNPAEPVG